MLVWSCLASVENRRFLLIPFSSPETLSLSLSPSLSLSLSLSPSLPLSLSLSLSLSASLSADFFTANLKFLLQRLRLDC